jgi:hypothetical protein
MEVPVRLHRVLTIAALAVTALASGSSRPAAAAGSTWIFGTNFGLTANEGDLVVGIPHGAFEFVRPGLRIGAMLPGRRHELFADYNLLFASGSGSSDHIASGTFNYQFNFTDVESGSAYLTAGLGVVSFSSDTYTLFGAGLGMRHWLANRHAAIRYEARVDRLSNDGFGTNFFGVKLGLDVKLN